MFYQTWTACIPPKGQKNAVFIPGDLTFDLWSWHSNSIERGPNASTPWIWRTFVQRFPRYFIQTKKPQTDSAKNRTFRSSLRAVKRADLLRRPGDRNDLSRVAWERDEQVRDVYVCVCVRVCACVCVRVCEDVDECALSVDSCHQLCINTDATYNCSCYDLYELVNHTRCLAVGLSSVHFTFSYFDT